MKPILAILTALTLSSAAWGGQTIRCKQINEDGALKKKGIELILTMTSKKSGFAQVNGLNRNAIMNGLNELKVQGINQGTAIDDSKYTTIFLAPKEDEGMLDIQLQFNSIVLGKNFSQTRAVYVIGSDDANPETSFSYGYDMICNGKI